MSYPAVGAGVRLDLIPTTPARVVVTAPVHAHRNDDVHTTSRRISNLAHARAAVT